MASNKQWPYCHLKDLEINARILDWCILRPLGFAYRLLLVCLQFNKSLNSTWFTQNLKSANRLFSDCCMKLRLYVVILYFILNAKMEVLYKLLCRKRFQTSYLYIRPIFRRQETTLFKFFCMKERLGLHMIKVYLCFGDIIMMRLYALTCLMPSLCQNTYHHDLFQTFRFLHV